MSRPSTAPSPLTPPRSTRRLALALAFLLTACAHAPTPEPASLGTLQLHQPLQIEPDAATARLQYGALVARNAVQEFDPFCVFEIDTVRPTPQTVNPGLFQIVGVTRRVETFAGMPVLFNRVTFRDDDLPSHIYYKTTFRLRDTQQPVRALTCMSNQNVAGNVLSMRHLTQAEIRGALGTWFTLNWPARR